MKLRLDEDGIRKHDPGMCSIISTSPADKAFQPATTTAHDSRLRVVAVFVYKDGLTA